MMKDGAEITPKADAGTGPETKLGSPVYKREGRLPSLDGWRAVAILLVLGDHFLYAVNFPEAKFPWWRGVFQGNLGVRLFFVISGFLITHLLLREADQHGRISLYNFYCRRVLRIFPVYFAYLLVMVMLALAGLYSDTFSSWAGSFTFTRNLFGSGESATNHLWSLAVEEQFYLIWPVMLVQLALHRRPRLAVVLLAVPVILCPFLRNSQVQPGQGTQLWVHLLGSRSIFMYADSLAIGCAGAFLFRRRWILPAKMGSVACAGMTLTLIIASSNLISVPWQWMQGIQSMLMMAAIYTSIKSQSGVIYKILNTRVMVWIGVLSYSIYIWHLIFVGEFAGPRLNGFAIYDWRIWWIPALAVATVSYYFLEKPILRLKSRFN